MTATQLPPAAKATMESVRESLADIRDRLSDLDGPDWESIGEQASQLVDKATGRSRRRSRWPFVALGVLAVVGLAVGVAMFMMSRNGMQELETEEDRVWSPGEDGTSPTSHAAGTFEKRGSGTAAGTSRTGMADNGSMDSFPASDPMPSPMTPGIGGS